MMERDKASQLWTNEKHSHYLDAMEASFVRTMLEDPCVHRPLPLDRYMPDSCDSTLDLKSRPSSSSGTSKMDANADIRWKRHATDSSNNSPSALDQVVPQMRHKGEQLWHGSIHDLEMCNVTNECLTKLPYFD